MRRRFKFKLETDYYLEHNLRNDFLPKLYTSLSLSSRFEARGDSEISLSSRNAREFTLEGEIACFFGDTEHPLLSSIIEFIDHTNPSKVVLLIWPVGNSLDDIKNYESHEFVFSESNKQNLHENFKQIRNDFFRSSESRAIRIEFVGPPTTSQPEFYSQDSEESADIEEFTDAIGGGKVSMSAIGESDSDYTFLNEIQHMSRGEETADYVALRVNPPSSENLSTNEYTSEPSSGLLTQIGLFATNRKLDADGEYSGEISDQICYGKFNVTLPRDHRIGELERPSIFRFEFRENENKHVVIQTLESIEWEEFSGNISNLDESENDLLVFVHGFNVTFDEGIMRGAQLAYDLQFKGIPIVFSWPSQGKVQSYTVDESTARVSEKYFYEFLCSLQEISTGRIHLIAHSMGNRIVANSLERISLARKPEQPFISHYILAAPDIDSRLFGELSRAFKSCSEKTTLYASSEDKALLASNKIHGYKRAGDTRGGIVTSENVDSIDATLVDTSLIGHSYYGDNRSIISDIFYALIHNIEPASRHTLQPLSETNSRIWKIRV